jgi:hypothetical protein
MPDAEGNLSRKELEEMSATYKRINESGVCKDLIKAMFADWCPFPDKAYAKLVGWPVNEDGTIDTPGLGRVPSRELCEEKELEQLYEVSDLEHLHKLEDPR